jgi:hypothetical protein
MAFAVDASTPAAALPSIHVANRHNQTLAYGLITIRAPLPEDKPIPLHCDVDVASVRTRIAASKCLHTDTGGGLSLLIHLNTHLLPNGPTSACVTIEWDDGRRATYPTTSFTIDNTTKLAQSVSSDLKAHGTPAVFGGMIDSSLFPYHQGETKAWFDTIEPASVPLSFNAAPSLEWAHRHLERWGFCILPEKLPAELISAFREELDTAISSGRLKYESGSSQRIHDAHKLPSGRSIWLHPPVLRFLEEHFRDPPCACQTLTYVHGSEQGGHQDTIHLTPYPAGYMCGVWIALEDVAPDSGELFVYPGSHKTPRLRAGELGLAKVSTDYSSYVTFDRAIQKLVAEGGYERAEYRPTAGQILVWHENLIHGGSYRRDRTKTRLSIVSHYFAKGAVAYYDSRGEAASLELLPEQP